MEKDKLLASSVGVHKKILTEGIEKIIQDSGGGGTGGGVTKQYVDTQDELRVLKTDAFTQIQADELYQAKGDYALVGDSYTKSEIDSELSKKLNIIDAFTQEEADILYKPIGYIPDLTNQPISNILGLQTALDNKSNQATTYTKSEVDTALALKLDATTLATKLRNFNIKYAKTGLNLTVNSSSTALVNITGVIKTTPTITSFGVNLSGDDIQAPTLTSVGTGANSGFKFPVISGMPNFILNITVRVWGTLSGSANTPRELIVYLRRVSDNSIIANGGIIKVVDNNVNGRSTIISSFVKGSNDHFITGGFYLDCLNNSGSNLTITQLEVLFQGF